MRKTPIFSLANWVSASFAAAESTLQHVSHGGRDQRPDRWVCQVNKGSNKISIDTPATAVIAGDPIRYRMAAEQSRMATCNAFWPGRAPGSPMSVNAVEKGAFSIAVLSQCILLGFLLAIGYACSQTQETGGQLSVEGTAPASVQLPPSNVAASLIEIHGRVVSVDPEEKLVKLQAAGGKPVSLHVFNQDSLAAAKQGEPFVAKFYEIASIQKLPPDQSPPAESLAAGIVNAVPGEMPVAALVNQYQFAVTVDAIDKNHKAISIKGSDGMAEVVEVANPESLDQVQAGEQVVVTLIDVVAVTLDREAGSAKATPDLRSRPWASTI